MSLIKAFINKVFHVFHALLSNFPFTDSFYILELSSVASVDVNRYRDIEISNIMSLYV